MEIHPFSCKLAGQHKAEAYIVVAIRWGVIVAISHTTIGGTVVPTTTTFDTVRARWLHPVLVKSYSANHKYQRMT